MEKKSCDCFIGFLSGERVYKSDISYKIESIEKIQPTFKAYGIMKGEPLSKKQIVDNRRGYLSRFAFCPHCGKNLNWKSIIENI